MPNNQYKTTFYNMNTLAQYIVQTCIQITLKVFCYNSCLGRIYFVVTLL